MGRSAVSRRKASASSGVEATTANAEASDAARGGEAPYRTRVRVAASPPATLLDCPSPTATTGTWCRRRAGLRFRRGGGSGVPVAVSDGSDAPRRDAQQSMGSPRTGSRRSAGRRIGEPRSGRGCHERPGEFGSSRISWPVPLECRGFPWGRCTSCGTGNRDRPGGGGRSRQRASRIGASRSIAGVTPGRHRPIRTSGFRRRSPEGSRRWSPAAPRESGSARRAPARKARSCPVRAAVRQPSRWEWRMRPRAARGSSDPPREPEHRSIVGLSKGDARRHAGRGPREGKGIDGRTGRRRRPDSRGPDGERTRRGSRLTGWSDAMPADCGTSSGERRRMVPGPPPERRDWRQHSCGSGERRPHRSQPTLAPIDAVSGRCHGIRVWQRMADEVLMRDRAGPIRCAPRSGW